MSCCGGGGDGGEIAPAKSIVELLKRDSGVLHDETEAKLGAASDLTSSHHGCDVHIVGDLVVPGILDGLDKQPVVQLFSALPLVHGFCTCMQR